MSISPVEKYRNQILETKLVVNLRSRGAGDVQVFVKENPDKTIRVQFRNKHTLQQVHIPAEKCEAMVAALPPTFTLEELMTHIATVEGSVKLK